MPVKISAPKRDIVYDRIPRGGGVLGYISDGDVRRPFLGLNGLGLFLGLKFSGGLFLPLRFWRGLFWGLMKIVPYHS